MNGKRTCSLLKSIRCKIAEQNGIEFSTPECTFQGECKGTCPKCEAELRYLAEELEKLRTSGKRVAVAGIAATMIATSAAGCARQPDPDEFFETNGLIVEEPSDVVLDGDVAFPEENGGDNVDGVVATPEEEGEIDDGSRLTGEVASPPMPSVVSFGTMEYIQVYNLMFGRPFLSLDGEWQDYLVYHDENERYADYSDENVTVRVHYNEAGFITEASVDTTPGEDCDA